MMRQSDLFGPEPVVLISDEQEGIQYLPGALDRPTAERWMHQTHSNVSWNSHRRMMYDREVAVPRLLAGYRYDQTALPEPIEDAFDFARTLAGVPFNSVGLNLYRDGSDSVALHNDKTEQLVVGAPIAILSLGQTRRMQIRAKEGRRGSIFVELEAGSLLVMSYACQFTHDHGIPKAHEEIGSRISLAFRFVIPDPLN